MNIISSQSVMLGRGRLWCWSCGATNPFLFWDLCLGCVTEPVSNSCWNLLELELEIWSSHPEPTAHKQQMLLGHQSARATWCTVSAAQASPPSLASILPPACLVSLCFFFLNNVLRNTLPQPWAQPISWQPLMWAMVWKAAAKLWNKKKPSTEAQGSPCGVKNLYLLWIFPTAQLFLCRCKPNPSFKRPFV